MSRQNLHFSWHCCLRFFLLVLKNVYVLQKNIFKAPSNGAFSLDFWKFCRARTTINLCQLRTFGGIIMSNAFIDITGFIVIVTLFVGMIRDEIEYRKYEHFRQTHVENVRQHIRQKFGRR